MSNTISFIKGVGFTLTVLTCYLVGFDFGRKHPMEQCEEENENDSVQDAEVEEI